MMRAGVWTGEGHIVCQEWEEPTLTDDSVLVDVGYCGFCGSDPHIIEGNLPIGRPPQVLGHEVSGTISAVGQNVRGLEPGLRVGANLYGYCGVCPWCRAGQPNHCRRKFFSAKGFAERALYRPQQLFVLPDDVSLEQGSFLEPVATCLHALDVSGLRPGESALIIGAGPLGLITMQLARAAGAATVMVSEPRERSRDLALELGADAVLDPRSDDLEAVASGVGDRRGFDVVFEVAGAPSAAAQAPELASTRGRVVLVGVFDRDVEVPIRPYLLYEREITIRGSIAADRTFPRALGLLSQLRLEELISAVEPLGRIDDVYRSHKEGEQVKVLVQP